MSRGDQIASTGLGRMFRGQTAIDFYGKRRVGLVVAVIVVVVTFGALFTRGLNLGLDFEGGDAWDIPASETFTTDDAATVRSVVEQVLTGQTKRWEFEKAGAGEGGRAMAQYKVKFKKSIPSTLALEAMRRAVLPKVVTIDVRDV